MASITHGIKPEEEIVVCLTLRHAKRSDFTEVKRYDAGKNPVYGIRNGVPYWLLNSKGKLENKNYISGDHLDLEEFKTWFNNKQIYVLK